MSENGLCNVYGTITQYVSKMHIDFHSNQMPFVFLAYFLAKDAIFIIACTCLMRASGFEAIELVKPQFISSDSFYNA